MCWLIAEQDVHLITSAKVVAVFCQQDYAKTTSQSISMRSAGRVEHGPRKERNLDQGANPGIFFPLP